MKVLEKFSGNYLDAEIIAVDKKELTRAQLKRFEFDWRKEFDYELYKLILCGSKKILGLMSLVIISNELRIEIRLLESSKENVGNGKEYDRIAGCMIAFACRLSFKYGFDGFVSLIPKTNLIEYYMSKYNLSKMGRHLVTEGDNSQRLIMEYIENSII